MENSPQFGSTCPNEERNTKKNDFLYNLEEHSLSLRKKRNNKVKKYILPNSLQNNLTYEINLSELQPQINNHQLYIQFKNSSDEKNSLGLLFQMLLIEDNNDIIKFSLANLKIFLINIERDDFITKKLSAEFSDKLIKYLFELLFKKSNDFYILSNICFILNKLSYYLKSNESDGNESEYFFDILFSYFNNILDFIKGINPEESQVKNLLYLLTDKIFLASDDTISKIEKNYPGFIFQIQQELVKLSQTQNYLVKNMLLISTLLKIIGNCFYYKIYFNYFLSAFNFNNIMNNNFNITYNNNNNSNINFNETETNVENIIQFISNLLKFSYEKEILEQGLRCVQNFMCFFNENDLENNKGLKKKIHKIIKNLELEKKIIPMIFDNTTDDHNLRIIVLQVFVNAIFLSNKKFCETLIENNIAEQIIKLENYLINQTQFSNKTKNIYRLLMDLIYNLIENESVYIIDNLSIDNSCISLLFKIQKIPFYSKENNNYMIKIFNILIQTNQKYIQTLLISEGICEWYKNILENEPSKENIKMIISNFITMVQYSRNLVDDKSNKNNLLLIHLEKIGIAEVVNNLKNRTDLSDEEMLMINDFSNLFN